MIDSERELISNHINIACSAGLSVGLMPDGTAVVTIACEQALCLGKKMARKVKGKGGREAFSLFPLPTPLDQRPVHRLLSPLLFKRKILVRKE